MATTSEKVIERYLKSQIESMGGICRKFVPLVTGDPDRLCFLPGAITILAELKSTGKKPSPLQKIRHEAFRKLGFRVEVIDSVSGVDSLIESIKQQK